MFLGRVGVKSRIIACLLLLIMGCNTCNYTAETVVKSGDRVAVYNPQTNQLRISMPITGEKASFAKRVCISNCMMDQWKIVCCELKEKEAHIVLEPVENTKGLLSGLEFGLANIVTVRNR
jgi:hypothetical protein